MKLALQASSFIRSNGVLYCTRIQSDGQKKITTTIRGNAGKRRDKRKAGATEAASPEGGYMGHSGELSGT